MLELLSFYSYIMAKYVSKILNLISVTRHILDVSKWLLHGTTVTIHTQVFLKYCSVNICIKDIKPD